MKTITRWIEAVHPHLELGNYRLLLPFPKSGKVHLLLVFWYPFCPEVKKTTGSIGYAFSSKVFVCKLNNTGNGSVFVCLEKYLWNGFSLPETQLLRVFHTLIWMRINQKWLHLRIIFPACIHISKRPVQKSFYLAMIEFAANYQTDVYKGHFSRIATFDGFIYSTCVLALFTVKLSQTY